MKSLQTSKQLQQNINFAKYRCYLPINSLKSLKRRIKEGYSYKRLFRYVRSIEKLTYHGDVLLLNFIGHFANDLGFFYSERSIKETLIERNRKNKDKLYPKHLTFRYAYKNGRNSRRIESFLKKGVTY